MLTFSDTADETETAAILDILIAHNDLHTEPSRRVPFRIVARAIDGSIAGGAIGFTIHRWTYVDILALRPEHRGAGQGAALLAEVEKLARARGAIGVHLTSYSFQAPDFYKKYGYTEFGRIDGMPSGQANVWLMKRL